MKLFRHSSTVALLSLLLGAVFLNMSFFMAEVSMLQIKDKQLLENIADLVANSGCEEERDGETSTKDSVKEVDIISQLLVHHISIFLIGSKSNQTLVDHYPHANHSLTFSPPPDIA